MVFARLIVYLNAVVFALYGLVFIFVPELMASFVTDGSPSTASGVIDMRATYGGMSLAVGLLLFHFAGRTELVAVGLLLVVVTMLCMAVGRVVGIVLDGSANTLMFVYLALELVVAGLAMAATRGLQRGELRERGLESEQNDGR